MYRASLSLVMSLFVFSFTQEAFAYIDPGTGSMLLQLLLGGVAGAMVVGKLYWQRLKEMLPGARRATPPKPALAEDTNQASRTDH